MSPSTAAPAPAAAPAAAVPTSAPSAARIAANRANALKSTGPTTAAGKARSRANAYRHGMAGDGVVLSPADEVEVAQLTAALASELRPRGPLDQILVRRAAVMAVRLDHCATHERAATSYRVRHAAATFQADRRAEVDQALARIADQPAASVRVLRQSPEGLTHLIAAWRGIEAALDPTADPFLAELAAVESAGGLPPSSGAASVAAWTPALLARAENLMGRRPTDFPASRLQRLTDVLDHDPSAARRAWATGEIQQIITAEVTDLRSQLDACDPDQLDLDTAEAADRAQFDPGPDATLARKYEAAAERAFFRALRELKVQQDRSTEALVGPPPSPPAAERPVPPLGSFGPAQPPPASVPARPDTQAARRARSLGSFLQADIERSLDATITAARRR